MNESLKMFNNFENQSQICISEYIDKQLLVESVRHETIQLFISSVLLSYLIGFIIGLIVMKVVIKYNIVKKVRDSLK